MSAIWLGLALATARQGLDFAQPMHLEVKSEGAYRIVLTETALNQEHPATTWEGAFVSPPVADFQAVREADLYVPGHPQSRAELRKDESPLHVPYLAVEFVPSDPSEAAAPRLELSFEVTVYEKRLVQGASSERPFPLDAAQRAAYTASTSEMAYGAPDFAAWIEANSLTKGATESEAAFAYRALRVVADKFKPAEAGAAPEALDIGRQASVDPRQACLIYCGVLRAAGVPARMVEGVPLTPFVEASATSENPIVRIPRAATAEAYVRDVGWVPVDVFAALGAPSVVEYFGLWNHSMIALDLGPLQLGGRSLPADRGLWRSSPDGGYAGLPLQREKLVSAKR